VGVADGGHVHAHQLELGAHVGAEEFLVMAVQQVVAGDIGHAVAGRDQPVNLVVPQRAFANGVNVFVAGAADVVDGDAAARADGEAGRLGQFVTRADTGGEQDHVRFQHLAVGELHGVTAGFAVHDFLGVALGVDADAQRFDLAAQQAAAAVINLHRHQPGREFDDMGLQAQVLQRLGGFQPQQAAAHHHAHLRLGGGIANGFQVFNGAVDQAAFAVVARHRRHEGIGAGGQHQLVALLFKRRLIPLSLKKSPFTSDRSSAVFPEKYADR
jgi:hypothetical protein